MNNFFIKYLPSKQLFTYFVTTPFSYINTLIPAILMLVGGWLAENSVQETVLLFIFCVFLGAYFLLGKGTIINQKMRNKAIYYAGKNLREDLMVSMLTNKEELVSVSVLLNDVGRMEESYFPAVIDLIEQLILYVIVFLIMFVKSPILAVYMAVISVVLALIGNKGRQNGMKLQGENSMKQEEMLDFLEHTNKGYATIFVYDLHKKMTIAFKKLSSALTRIQERLQWEQSKTENIMMAFLLLASLTAVLVGNLYILKGMLSVAELLVMIQLSNNLFKPIQRIMGDWYQIIAIKETEKKLKRLLNISQQTKKKKLQEIPFAVNSGEKILLIGENGCGKSTLLRNMLELFEGDKNSIIAPVSQQIFLLPGTVLENVSSFQADNTNRALEALEIVGLKELAEREDIQGLSGGQQQRIALARAIASGRDFLILDEAFSAVNPQMHNEIEEKLLSNKDITIIAVEHRLSRKNYFMYNKVVLLQNEQVHIMGTPQEMQEHQFVQGLLQEREEVDNLG